MRNIKRIFIHCTASSRKTSIEQLLAEFKSRGWHAPGYHYVAMPDGRMVKLLDEEKDALLAAHPEKTLEDILLGMIEGGRSV